MNLSQYIVVGDTTRGKGIFASKNIDEGEELFTVIGKPVSFEIASKLGENESYCLQTDIDCYIIPHYPFILSNHSCEPNCGIKDGYRFVTIRNIKEGEELVWDYSTSMLERKWKLECSCETDSCRHVIEDFDKLPVSTRQLYIKLGIVMPFIVKLINEGLIKKAI